MENLSIPIYPIHRFNGLITNIKDINEYDSIFAIYTKESGMINVFSKSLRKISSKMRTMCQEGNIVEVEILCRKSGFILTGIRELDVYYKSDIEKDALFLKVIHLLNRLICGSEKNDKLFEDILYYKKFIYDSDNDYSTKDKERGIFISILSHLGYRPDISGIDDGKSLDEILLFIKERPNKRNFFDRRIKDAILKTSL